MSESNAYTDQLEADLATSQRQLAGLYTHLEHLDPDLLDRARWTIMRREQVDAAIAHVIHFLPFDSRRAQDAFRAPEGGPVLAVTEEMPIDSDLAIRVEMTVTLAPYTPPEEMPKS